MRKNTKRIALLVTGVTIGVIFSDEITDALAPLVTNTKA